MDYRKSLEQAVIYIEANLREDIRVEEVAKAAGYSYYHLNRQFYSLLGETIGSYIKKRRLADGAKRLLYTDERIIDIAIDSGFESSEAFSRAFKAVYRVSPQLYRTNRLDAYVGAKERLDQGLLQHLIANVTVHPKIVTVPEIKVAGIRGGNHTLRYKAKRSLEKCKQYAPPHTQSGEGRQRFWYLRSLQ